MAAPKFIIQHTIATKASIKAVGHAELQKKYGRKGHVVFGRHTPDWKLMRVHVEWNDAKKLEAGLKSVTMDVSFKGTIQISKAIPNSSKCYKLVKAHEEQHHKICVDGTKAAKGACEKIMQKHFMAVLKSYKGDYAAFRENEEKAIRKFAFAAYPKIEDGPYYKVAVKSAGLDTKANYAKISPHCAAYG